MVKIDVSLCVVCGGCIDLCPKISIKMVDDTVVVDPETCSGCNICVQVCPMNAPYVCDD